MTRSKSVSRLAALLFFWSGQQSIVAQTWTGLGANSNVSTASNWTPVGMPTNDGTANLVFSGATRLTPNIDLPWSVNAVSFGASAGTFTVGGNALTIGAGGVTDNQASKIEKITS